MDTVQMGRVSWPDGQVRVPLPRFEGVGGDRQEFHPALGRSLGAPAGSCMHLRTVRRAAIPRQRSGDD